MRPRVSVIIPTYNRAALIEEAIDSVLAQTYGACEIVVADDGSTDDTAERLARYGDRVRYVRTEHGGVAHARNVGTRAATGEYLAYLDSDDRLYPYAIEIQAALLQRFPAVAFVCAEMSGFDDHGYLERYHLKTYHASAYRDSAVTYDRIFSTSEPLTAVMDLPATLTADDPTASQRRVYTGSVFDVYLLKTFLCQNSILVRRAIVDEVGERNPGIRHWQEVDFLLRICRRHPICFVDVPTYQLRYHDGQVSGTGGVRGKDAWARKQRILLRVIKRHALADDGYYQRHRVAINRHLAQLHRAVAVPLLLSDSPEARRLGYARRARPYLRRAALLSAPSDLLWLSSCLPDPVRRAAVTAVERLRRLWMTSAGRIGAAASASRGPWTAVALGVAGISTVLVSENLGATPLNRLLLRFPGVDKALHVVQSFLIFRVLHWLIGDRAPSAWGRVLLSAVGTLALACFDEFQQAVMPGRSVEFADVVASAAGATLAAGSVVVYRNARLAAALTASAALGAGLVTYESYATTKDYKSGLRLAAAGRHGEAATAFRRALDVDGENAELLNTLAWSILQGSDGRADDAVRFARRSLDLRPDDANTLDTYGWALYRAGRFVDARVPLEQALARDPDIYCIHYHLGATYLRLGDRAAAERHLRSQIDQFPDAAEAAQAADALQAMEGGQ